MKRVFVCFILIALVAAAFGTFTVGAACAEEANDAVFTMSKTQDGRDLYVKIDLAENEGIITFALRLEYNAKAIELVDRSFGAALTAIDGAPVDTFGEEDVSACPYIIVGVGMGENSTKTGAFLTLHFRVKEKAVNGKYSLALYVTDLSYKSGSITLTNPKYVTKATSEEQRKSGGIQVATESYRVTTGVAAVNGRVLAIVLGLVGGVLLIGGVGVALYFKNKKKKKD
ncbi:MAG TPA: hypothetical protein DHV31_02335 [Clostridiales bacterium]|nr:hypothetical protein [Clostridiales bacterium]